MYMFDNEISIANREILEQYLNGYEYKTSGLSFSAQYMWREINRFSWDMVGEYMCISGISHLELEDGIELPFMFPPLTSTGEYDKEALRDAGIAYAVEQIVDLVSSGVQGIHLYTMNNPYVARKISESITSIIKSINKKSIV